MFFNCGRFSLKCISLIDSSREDNFLFKIFKTSDWDNIDDKSSEPNLIILTLLIVPLLIEPLLIEPLFVLLILLLINCLLIFCKVLG